nr:MAG TPA_asm: Clr5 domain protein [Caudoviricetes sp.]
MSWRMIMKYFIHGVQVTRRQWKQYIKIWK